jgi:hypothetical protein
MHIGTFQVRDAVISLGSILSTLKTPEAEKAGESNRVAGLN